jgi:DNA-binding PadR family transcriptional regulator
MKIMRKRRQQATASRRPGEVDRFVPLRAKVFALLAALAEGPKPGVQILERLEDIGSGILGPGTLYRLLRELRQQGLIERVSPPSHAAIEDERQQFHALSPLGRAVFEAESERLRRTLAVADGGRGSGGA